MFVLDHSFNEDEAFENDTFSSISNHINNNTKRMVNNKSFEACILNTQQKLTSELLDPELRIWYNNFDLNDNYNSIHANGNNSLSEPANNEINEYNVIRILNSVNKNKHIDEINEFDEENEEKELFYWPSHNNSDTILHKVDDNDKIVGILV